ncbi:hypothetical protein AGMMS49992_23770 [Clostridia bacterium]|nr:hypothetical protein AGMMS49992_23770 [Clostridia bacterium]
MYQKTNIRIRATLNGWDGKSFNGEAVSRNVYTIDNLPGARFVRVYSQKHNGYNYFYITNQRHPVSCELIAKFHG